MITGGAADTAPSSARASRRSNRRCRPAARCRIGGHGCAARSRTRSSRTTTTGTRTSAQAVRNLTVEKGGVGAGTVIRFEVRALGQTQRFKGFVTEPEPGRVLVEEYSEPASSKTTFLVEKSPSGSGTRVTFTTEMTSRKGLAGTIERFVSTRFMKKLYAEELGLLAARARRSV